LFFYSILIVFSLKIQAQSPATLEKSFDSESKEIEFQKESKYQGPKDWYSNNPPEINRSSTSEFEQDKLFSLESIITRNRQQEGIKEKKENQIKKPKELKIPEFNPPKINEPDIDLDIDTPNPSRISKSTWRLILFVLLFAVIILILYFWLKKINFNTNINQDFEENWNPELIEKSEFELRLENAIKTSNYREAIRVYYTIILQELIRLSFIKWKSDKTNQQYIYEIKNLEIRADFRNCTRLFDIVWYGEYEIDKSKFTEIEPYFQSFIQKLKLKKDE